MDPRLEACCRMPKPFFWTHFRLTNEGNLQPRGLLGRGLGRLIQNSRATGRSGNESAVDDTQGGHQRHGKINSHDSPDCAPYHQREKCKQGMNLQFVAPDASAIK